MTQGVHNLDVVVGVDGSDGSKLALRWGAYFAAQFGVGLAAVGAWEDPIGYGLAAVPVDWDAGEQMAEALRQTVTEVLGEQLAVPVRTLVREGGAAHVLLEASEHATILIVGSRGHGGFIGLLLGSVSASVAEHATCPVLVVHGDQLPPRTSPAG
jgi:nucleotide-binding universal stress UspA family protein